MRIGNPTKATLAALAMILLTILMATHTIDQAAGLGLLGSLVGYVVGNGVGAKTKVPVDPIVAPKEPHE